MALFRSSPSVDPNLQAILLDAGPGHKRALKILGDIQDQIQKALDGETPVLLASDSKTSKILLVTDKSVSQFSKGRVLGRVTFPDITEHGVLVMKPTGVS